MPTRSEVDHLLAHLDGLALDNNVPRIIKDRVSIIRREAASGALTGDALFTWLNAKMGGLMVSIDQTERDAQFETDRVVKTGIETPSAFVAGMESGRRTSITLRL